MKKYKNILFDMDGVLIDSMKYHTQAWVKTFSINNITVTEQKITSLAGMNSKETIQTILNENNIEYNEKKIKEITCEKWKQVDKIFKTDLYPNILNYLKQLKKNNYTIALVSGSTKFEVNKTVKENFENIFDLVISGEDVTNGKPNPEPYQKAIDKLKINKSETVIIEDAPKGIQSANSAQIDVFAIETTFKKENLEKYNPTKIFENHEKLFNFLLN